MKLLAIGYPLPHIDIDNYSPLTAPSFFDYDAVFVDPASFTRSAAQLLEEGHEFEAHDGRPVVNAPTTATAVSAADQLRRRADETRRLLEAGGVVIVAARPNATQAGVLGFEGCDRYSWLPAPEGMAWSAPYLRAAEGRTIRVVTDDHPAAPLMREHRRSLAYRATFDDRQAPVRQHARILATSGAAVPIAAEFSVLNGRVVFIPALPDETGTVRSDLAERLVNMAAQLTNDAVQPEAPYWSRGIPVPGLEQVEAELADAQAHLAESEARVAVSRERQDDLADHRRLLTDEGPALVRAVVRALALLEFAQTNQPGEPLAVESEGQLAYVECEGSRDEVVEWPYIRLQRRLEEWLLQHGDQLKGVVVVNGQRTLPPDERTKQFTDPLRNACDNYRYCLMTGETLFALVQRALGGAEPAVLTGMRRRILGAAGLLTTAVALGEADADKRADAGPIF